MRAILWLGSTSLVLAKCPAASAAPDWPDAKGPSYKDAGPARFFWGQEETLL